MFSIWLLYVTSNALFKKRRSTTTKAKYSAVDVNVDVGVSLSVKLAKSHSQSGN